MKICIQCKQMRLIPQGLKKCASCLTDTIKKIGDEMARQLDEDVVEFVKQTNTNPKDHPLAFKEFRELRRQQRHNDRRIHSAP